MVGVPPFELLSGLLGMMCYFEKLGRWTGEAKDRRSLIANAYRAVEQHEGRLLEILIGELSDIRELRLIGPTGDPKGRSRVPILSFTHRQGALGNTVKALTNHGIFCHWGRKFANEAANFLGVRPTDGFLRIGISHYTTLPEIEAFIMCARSATLR